MFQVCELDIIFNFEKAYFILDEFLMGGEVLETSKVAVGVSLEEADTLQEVLSGAGSESLVLPAHVNVFLPVSTDPGGIREETHLLIPEGRGSETNHVLLFIL